MRHEKIDRKAELVAIARLVTYARDSAAVIHADLLQERLEEALNAINAEMSGVRDPALIELLAFDKKPMTYQ